MSLATITYVFANGSEEDTLAQVTEQSKSLEQIRHRVFHFGEAQFDVRSPEHAVQAADVVATTSQNDLNLSIIDNSILQNSNSPSTLNA